MGFVLGQRSLTNLIGVHPNLVMVTKHAITITDQDFAVIEGVRTKERMWETWGKGRTIAQCAAKGIPAQYAKPREARVTWLNNPLMSNHRKMPDGYGHAVDCAPFPIDWSGTPANLKRFDRVAAAMFEAAEFCGVKIRWGADWDGDGNPRERGESDSPHFEIDLS